MLHMSHSLQLKVISISFVIELVTVVFRLFKTRRHCFVSYRESLRIVWFQTVVVNHVQKTSAHVP